MYLYSQAGIQFHWWCELGDKASSVQPFLNSCTNTLHKCGLFTQHDLIINDLGTEEDKQELQKYKDEFQLYAKRRIYQCLPQFGPVSETGQTNIFVKVDAHYESYTVQELRDFQQRLSEILHISLQRVLHDPTEDPSGNLTISSSIQQFYA